MKKHLGSKKREKKYNGSDSLRPMVEPWHVLFQINMLLRVANEKRKLCNN